MKASYLKSSPVTQHRGALVRLLEDPRCRGAMERQGVAASGLGKGVRRDNPS